MIISNFFVAFRGHLGKGSVMLLIMAALHVGFALACIFYFFNDSALEDSSSNGASTNTTAAAIGTKF